MEELKEIKMLFLIRDRNGGKQCALTWAMYDRPVQCVFSRRQQKTLCMSGFSNGLCFTPGRETSLF